MALGTLGTERQEEPHLGAEMITRRLAYPTTSSFLSQYRLTGMARIGLQLYYV